MTNEETRQTLLEVKLALENLFILASCLDELGFPFLSELSKKQVTRLSQAIDLLEAEAYPHLYAVQQASANIPF